MFTDEQDRLFEHLAGCAKAEKLPIFVVGGAVRDLFLGEDPADRDIDFLIEGNAIEFADRISARLGGTLKKFNDFYTAKIVSPSGYQSIDEVDLASSRTEVYANPGALPTVSQAPVAEDLRRRDFTINAMAVPLEALLDWGRSKYGDIEALASVTLDHFSGIKDLKGRLIRVIHERSFIDDPTRIFRGVRYGVRLGGNFEADSYALAVSAVKDGAIRTISKNRVLNELKKIAAERNMAQMIGELERLRVMQELELYPESEAQSLKDRLLRMEELFAKLSPAMKYGVFLQLSFAAYLSTGTPQQAQDRYLNLGLSRKEVKRMAEETTLPDNQVGEKSEILSKISDTGIVFLSIARGEGSSPALQAELHRRGLF